MTDKRIKITKTKPVDLAELDQQLGGHGLNDDEFCIMAIEGSPVTKEQLQNAYDAYDPSTHLKSQIQEQRRKAFENESDALFFSWQRGETSESEWLDKVAEIRARYPYS